MSKAEQALGRVFATACYLVHPTEEELRLEAAVTLSLADLTALGWIDTRLGQSSPALAAALLQHGVTQAQLLTPCNPGGRRIADDANDRALQAMRAMLTQSAQPWLHSLSMDDAGRWREPGFLLLGASPEQALHWAQAFDQAAWVEYDAKGQGELRWTANGIERGGACQH